MLAFEVHKIGFISLFCHCSLTKVHLMLLLARLDTTPERQCIAEILNRDFN
jgi:hypothetical protein